MVVFDVAFARMRHATVVTSAHCATGCSARARAFFVLLSLFARLDANLLPKTKLPSVAATK